MLNRKNHRLLGFSAVLLLIALGTMGVVHGLWTDDLVVTGSAQTGTLDASWISTYCRETNSAELGGVSIGSVVAEIDSSDPSLIHFSIQDGYPGYAVECNFGFNNTGTLPWIIRGNTILAGDNLTGCSLSGNVRKTLTCNEMTIMFEDNINQEFVPGDGSTSVMTVTITDAPESTDYRFSVIACLSQWNATLDFDSCMATLP